MESLQLASCRLCTNSVQADCSFRGVRRVGCGHLWRRSIRIGSLSIAKSDKGGNRGGFGGSNDGSNFNAVENQKEERKKESLILGMERDGSGSVIGFHLIPPSGYSGDPEVLDSHVDVATPTEEKHKTLPEEIMRLATDTEEKHPKIKEEIMRMGTDSEEKYEEIKEEIPKTRVTYNIIFVTAEAAPYSKTGGLGDVCGSLPIALAARGHRVMVVSPRYLNGTLADKNLAGAIDADRQIKIYCFGGVQEVNFFHEYREGVDWVRILHDCVLKAKYNYKE